MATDRTTATRPMRRLRARWGLLLVTLAAWAAPARAGEVILDVQDRPVTIHVPASYDPLEPTPLVILLHGFGVDGPWIENYLELLPLSDEFGFLYAFPTGTLFSPGVPYWNVLDIPGGPDDSAYLEAVLDEAGLQLNVDPERIHFVGHSNGGAMSYLMACEHPETVASVASLAGPSLCPPAAPVHALQIHGTADVVVPYTEALPAVLSWAGAAGCSLTPDDSAPDLDLAAGIPGAETTVSRYEAGCAVDGSAELWTIVGGSHAPILTADFGRKVIEFLYAHPKHGGVELWSDVGGGLAGTHGEPSLTGTGDLVAGSPVGLQLRGALENASVGLVLGFSALNAPFKGGVLVPHPDVLFLGLTTTAAGELALADTWPPGVPSGAVTWFQEWVTDPAGPKGFAASHGLSGTAP
jgi:polyhydroxybutyrate depolymerase